MLMKLGLDQLSAGTLNNYMLVVQPHEELRSIIEGMKKKFSEKFNAPQARSAAQVILSVYSGYDSTEARIFNRLETVARGLKPLKIDIRNFGSFPTHSIYLNIISRVPVSHLVKEIKNMQLLLRPDKEHKPYFIDEAHLPICKKLRPWQYEKAWLEYSHAEFTGRFIVNEIQLLGQRNGDKHFRPLRSFSLKGMGENISQGNLF